MTRPIVTRTAELVQEIADGNPIDSFKGAWKAIGAGGDVIAEAQRSGQKFVSLAQAMKRMDSNAKRLLRMRLDAIHKFKFAPHHRRGFRLSRHTGAKAPRPTSALCLISGHEGQEIPGFVDPDRVVVDAEHMEQALGPATLSEIFRIRKKIGEAVYISTNVSETPQIVRAVETGAIDSRATAALTASKVIAALRAGADVVKVGFANLDPFKRDLRSEMVEDQMRQVRAMVDEVVREKLLVFPLAGTEGRYPLISVFFPEVGIDSAGERPMEIAMRGLELTKKAKWQGLLIDTFEKYTHKRYGDFYSLEDTRTLAKSAHAAGIEFWMAGSIKGDEIRQYVKCGVDLICFGGAARHASAVRVTNKRGRRDESIKRPLVRQLVDEFDRVDPTRAPRKGRRR
jgi:uncharacterized protein (UPF0264 family)